MYDGTIARAQLRFGNGMFILGSVRKDEFGGLMEQPDEVGGSQTQTSYVVVADADAAHTLAKAGGAKIAVEIRDKDYGGRGFSCSNIEGHLWSFGSYDPWSHP